MRFSSIVHLIVPVLLTVCCMPLDGNACSGPSDYKNYVIDVALVKEHRDGGYVIMLVAGAQFLKKASKRGERFEEDLSNGIVSVDIHETSCGFGPVLLKTTPEEAKKIDAARELGKLSLMMREPESAPPELYQGEISSSALSNIISQRPGLNRGMFTVDNKTFELDGTGGFRLKQKDSE